MQRERAKGARWRGGDEDTMTCRTASGRPSRGVEHVLVQDDSTSQTVDGSRSHGFEHQLRAMDRPQQHPPLPRSPADDAKFPCQLCADS